MPSRWLAPCTLALACSCSATPQPPRAATQPTPPAARPEAGSPPSSPSSPPAGPKPAKAPLEKSFTGQAQPSLTITNAFPTSQHLFIDWVEQAVLPAGATQTFALSPGPHTITSSESADPDDHPAAVTEAFEAGYAYRYEIKAR